MNWKLRITFYVPGMTFDCNSITEGKSLGGSETAGYYVAHELARRGHDVTVFSNTHEDKSNKVDRVSYHPIGKPSSQYPLGQNFQLYAEHVPQDVLIGQRVPSFNSINFNAKLKLWWTHDLALKRFMGPVHGQLWNTQGVLTVSEFHKKQVSTVYDINPDVVHILRNGVDLSLFDAPLDIERKQASKTMVYSSRPERGLIHLVRPGGIMDRLYAIDPEIKLVVCGYDNTTETMYKFYEQLWGWCRQLPNVQVFGNLSKMDLAHVMQGAWLHCYPTDFEEVSCITAMEAQAAGNPIITTPTAALPETLHEAGVLFVDRPQDDEAFIDKFVRAIERLSKNSEQWDSLHRKALRKAQSYTWERSVDGLEETIEGLFRKMTDNPRRVVRHLIYTSDILAAKQLMALHRSVDWTEEAKLLQRYEPIFNSGKTYEQFYQDFSQFLTEDLKSNSALGEDALHKTDIRLKILLDHLATLPAGARVLDYGCSFGHHTIMMARTFPHLEIVGADISEAQLQEGWSYLRNHPVSNLSLVHVHSPDEVEGLFDFIWCREMLEHIPDPTEMVQALEAKARIGAVLMFSVPSGPSDISPTEFRGHITHFEHADLMDLFGHKQGFDMRYGAMPDVFNGDKQGNTTFLWTRSEDLNIGTINWDRKFHVQNPKQLVSVCMICRPDGNSLAKTLSTVEPLADEIIIAFDGKEGPGWDIAKRFGAQCFLGESPLMVGFAEARNRTIEKAQGDWILWIDDDEQLQFQEQLWKYLRWNPFTSYAIHHHHFTAEPAGLLKSDLPARLFRNGQGLKFFGIVHEHPESELNKGPGKAYLIPPNQGAICHIGYDTEATRRRRFERNFPLMERDRQVYPDRELGRFLWIRDLAQMNRFVFEQTKRVDQSMMARASSAVQLWEELCREKKLRLVQDSLPYYVESVDLLTQGQGIQFEMGAQSNWYGFGEPVQGPPVQTTKGLFLNTEHARLYAEAILADKLGRYENERYL